MESDVCAPKPAGLPVTRTNVQFWRPGVPRHTLQMRPNLQRDTVPYPGVATLKHCRLCGGLCINRGVTYIQATNLPRAVP